MNCDEMYTRDMCNVAKEAGLKSAGSLFAAMQFHYRYHGYVGTKDDYIKFAKDIESGKYDKS